MGYQHLLASHNLLRWLILFLFFLNIVVSALSWKSRIKNVSLLLKARLLLIALFDLQLVFGFLLYFIYSPLTTYALSNMAASMKDKNLRFFAVEHLALMVVAAVILHVASIKSKRVSIDDPHKAAGVWALGSMICLLVVCAGIPWFRAAIPNF